MSQVSYGTITITDMNDIEEIYTIYAGSNTEASPTFTYTAVTGGTTWKRDASALSGFKYIWQSTVVTKSGVTIDSTNWQQFYSQPVRLTGLEGDDARNIVSVTPYYYLSTSDSSQTGGSWSTTPQSYPSTGTAYYWTKTITAYDSGSPTESTAVLDMFLTNAAKDARDANKNAAIANSIAQHSNENAQGAMSQASATQVAQEALAHSLRKIWINENTVGDYVAGTYAASGLTNGEDSGFKTNDPSTYGFNSLLRHTFLSFRYNTHQLVTIGTGIATDSGGISGLAINTPILTNNVVTNVARSMELTSDALKFYHSPTISGNTVTNGTLAMELSGDALKFYGSSTSTPDASLSSTGLNLTKGSITLGNDFSVTNTGVLTAKSGTIGGWSFTDAALYYSDATPGYSTTNLVISKSSAVNTNAIAGSETNKPWFLAAGRKFGVDTEGNLYANNAHLSSATVEGAITATQLTISGGGATYDGASAINANGYTIEIIEDKTVAPTGSVITENQTYLYPVMYLNGVAVTTGITKTNYVWYTNENTATTGGVAGDSTNGGIIATYGNTYRVTYNLSDDAVGTTPSQQTIHTSDARHITDISSSGITIHPEDGTAGNYMQLDSDGLKIYKSSTLLANYGTTVTIGSSSAKNVYIDSNGVQIRDSATSLAEFGTTARIGQRTSSRFLMNSDSLQAYDNYNNLYFEVNSNGLTWGSGNTAATTAQVNTAAQTATNFIKTDGLGIKVQNSTDATNYVHIGSDGIQIYKNGNAIASFEDNITLGESTSIHNIITSTSFDFYKNQNTRIASIATEEETISGEGKYYLTKISTSGDDLQTNSGIKLQSNYGSYYSVLTLTNRKTSDATYADASLKTYATTSNALHQSYLTMDYQSFVLNNWSIISGHQLEVGLRGGHNSSNYTSNLSIEIGSDQTAWTSIDMNTTSLGTVGNISFSCSHLYSDVALTVTSDKRLKQHKAFLAEDANKFIRQLKPARFIRNGEEHLGFYAQDVEEANEWNVELTPYIKDYKGLTYTEIIAPLVAYCQHLEKRIDDLENQNRGGTE